MSREGGETADKPTKPGVDVYRAGRQFERMFKGGRDALGLFDYRTSWEKAIDLRQEQEPYREIDPEEWIPIATIIFRPDRREIIIERVVDKEETTE